MAPEKNNQDRKAQKYCQDTKSYGDALHKIKGKLYFAY